MASVGYLLTRSCTIFVCRQAQRAQWIVGIQTTVGQARLADLGVPSISRRRPKIRRPPAFRLLQSFSSLHRQ